MKNYRDLFEQEFGGDPRIFDIEGAGLKLGIKTLPLEEAMNLLVKMDIQFLSQGRGDGRNLFAKDLTQRRGDAGAQREEEGEGVAKDLTQRRRDGKILFAKDLTQRRGDAEARGGGKGKEEYRGEELRGTDMLVGFVEGEVGRLRELRGLLSGEAAADDGRLSVLIDECDYLWAHFPDYAAGRRPALSDISFLKRLRTEIDPMIDLQIHLAEAQIRKNFIR
jgi:hypothetical protein